MSSLTIRLDDTSSELLDFIAKSKHQSKSEIARKGILDYLKKQQKIEQQKVSYLKKIEVSSKNDVVCRVNEAVSAKYLTDAQYEDEMNAFFNKELGLIR